MAAKHSIMAQNSEGKQNWLKIIDYLFEITNIPQHPTKNKSSNDKLIDTFKKNLKSKYEQWWRVKMQPNDSTKYDFYYKYKKNYIFEDYLDHIPRHIRLYTTRLRTSSHNLPVETMRYTKPKPERKDRKCDICNMDMVGDEHHYLLQCSNPEIISSRSEFLENIRQKITQLKSFNETEIMNYCLTMADENIYIYITQYIKEILNIYREEKSEVTKPQPQIITKSGRFVKPPKKLNL